MKYDIKTNTCSYYLDGPEKIDDGFTYFVNPSDLKPGMLTRMPGYPGEYEGHAYMGEGQLTKVDKTKLGGYVIYYNTQTSPGNSGSAVQLVDSDGFNLVKQIRDKDSYTAMTIGVHTGHGDSMIEPGVISSSSYGTLLTKEIWDWKDAVLENLFDKK